MGGQIMCRARLTSFIQALLAVSITVATPSCGDGRVDVARTATTEDPNGQVSAFAFDDARETQIAIGQSKTINVRAANYWNDSGLRVAVGEVYEFSAPKNKIWIDLTIPSTADGYATSIIMNACKGITFGFCSVVNGPGGAQYLDSQKRVPTANFFTLIGNVGATESQSFVIGTTKVVTIDHSGKFYAFANDWPSRYGNNSLAIPLTIKRIK